MNIFRISIIPIELFDPRNRKDVLLALSLSGMIDLRLRNQALRDLLVEISPEDTEVFSVINAPTPTLLVFCETSACIVIIESEKVSALTRDFVSSELAARSQRHREIIAGADVYQTSLIVASMKQAASQDTREFIRVNYVFGFFCLQGDDRLDDEQKSYLKILAEPSILDVDDMLSSKDFDIQSSAFPPADHRLFKKLVDIDPSASTTTYMTWATIVSYSIEGEYSERTRLLLIALEVRLQSTWNRCYAFSELANRVFRGSAEAETVKDLYWQFVRALDDAQGVISSTLSSRAGTIFAEMVRTSNLAGEVNKLDKKLSLLEKFADLKERQKSQVYRKTIELLLFMAVLASIIQVVMPIPIITEPFLSGLLVLFIAVIGLIAIIFSK